MRITTKGQVTIPQAIRAAPNPCRALFNNGPSLTAPSPVLLQDFSSFACTGLCPPHLVLRVGVKPIVNYVTILFKSLPVTEDALKEAPLSQNKLEQIRP